MNERKMQQQRRADEEGPRSLAAAEGAAPDHAAGWEYPREYLSMNPDLAGRSLDDVARHYFQHGWHEGRNSKHTWKNRVDELYSRVRDRSGGVLYAVMCDAADEHAVVLARRVKSALLEARPEWRCVSGADEHARPHLVVHLVEAHRLHALPHDMDTVGVAWTWVDESLGPIGPKELVAARACADLVVAMCPAAQAALSGHAHVVQPAVCGEFPDAASSKELRDMPAHTGPAFWAADAFTHTMLCEGDVPDAAKDPVGHRAIVSHLRKSRRARACMFERQRMIYSERDWSAVGADLVALLERRLGVGRWHVDIVLLDVDSRSLEYAFAIKDRLVGVRGTGVHVLLPGEAVSSPPADRSLYIGDGAAPDGALRLDPRDLAVPMVDFSRFAPRRGVRRANTVSFARDAAPGAYPHDTVVCMPHDTGAIRRGELLAGAKFAICDDGQSACEALAAGCGVVCTQGEAEAKAWFDALPRKARTKNVRFGADSTRGVVQPTSNTMGQLKLVCDFMDMIDRDIARPY
jgi:hypothetical protein